MSRQSQDDYLFSTVYGEDLGFAIHQLLYWCPAFVAFYSPGESGLFYIEVNLETDFSRDPNTEIEIDQSMDYVVEVPLEIDDTDTLTLTGMISGASRHSFSEVPLGYYRLIADIKELSLDEAIALDGEFNPNRRQFTMANYDDEYAWAPWMFRFTLIPVSAMPEPRYHKFGDSIGQGPDGR
ncbi:MAG: hypothetical protein AAFX78_00425 [Cyanobacteria bacterium J06638_20]